MNLEPIRLSPPSTRPHGVWPAYNLFRSRRRPDLLCAVSEDYPVPAFLGGHGWDFAGTVDTLLAAPPGFEVDAARVGMRLNGYYLFTTLHAESLAGGEASRLPDRALMNDQPPLAGRVTSAADRRRSTFA